MLAIRPNAPGGPEILTLAETATPAPGPGEALIRVEAAGVNFIDIYQRSGQYKVATPMALGLEGAGVVESVGDGACGVSPGERVAGPRGRDRTPRTWWSPSRAWCRSPKVSSRVSPPRRCSRA
jgi:NADPH2:quinone reductase